MHRLAPVAFLLLVLPASPSDQISKFDISGDWQSGPPENQNPAHYHLTQQGDNLTSDGDYGPFY
jgi:hypothetical protein